MRIILASFFVIAWLLLGYSIAQQLTWRSEFLTALGRAGLALIWIWAMWVLVDLIPDSKQKN